MKQHLPSTFITKNLFVALDNDSIRIKNLTQHFRDAIQQEINETNDRITKFNEEQFRLLNLFREKAEQEYNALVRYGPNHLSSRK